jgi:hypothetical protein
LDEGQKVEIDRILKAADRELGQRTQ